MRSGVTQLESAPTDYGPRARPTSMLLIVNSMTALFDSAPIADIALVTPRRVGALIHQGTVTSETLENAKDRRDWRHAQRA